MAFQRRAGKPHFRAPSGPGSWTRSRRFLMVMIFLLTIFMVVQYVLREEITNQDDELNALNARLNNLSEALGLETSRADRLESRVATLTGIAEPCGGRGSPNRMH